jgi:hypothetical protein
MCPHTTRSVFSYFFCVSPYCSRRRMLEALNVAKHGSSCYQICVLILPYVSSHYYTCPHTTTYAASSYYYICVHICVLILQSVAHAALNVAKQIDGFFLQALFNRCCCQSACNILVSSLVYICIYLYVYICI